MPSYTYREHEYPQNLLFDIFNPSHSTTTTDITTYTSPESLQGLNYALSKLSSKRYQIIDLRYRRRYTLSDIATEYGVTRERVRQIIDSSLRMLRTPKYKNPITMGLNPFIENKETEIKQKGKSIYKLDIGYRARMALLKAGYYYIADIENFSVKDFRKIYNIGKVTANEIVEAIDEYKKGN